MKKISLKLLLMLFTVFTISFVACEKDEDEPTYLAPTVTAPANQDLKQGIAVDLTFNFTAEAGFKSSAIETSNGAATIKTDGVASATSGTVVVTFTANANTGAASVKLTVTDNKNQSDDATAVINVAVQIAPNVTAPANQELEQGAVVDLTFNFTAEEGFQSSAIETSNGAATIKTDGVASATSGTVVVTFTANANIGAASVKLTVTDNKNQSDEATAVINVTEIITTIDVTANVTENTTWETGKTYILQSRIAVVAGVTLTIQPGVIIKGEAGTGANATALLVARGATIMAEGTAEAPIIFTSVADEIEPGQIESPNLEPTLNGLWGGLLILGNAPISADAASVQIEGIPPSDPNGLYGGDNAADNSGVIKYVSIRHGGANIGEGNEINGLTLGGVGSATIIENIEIVANQDDGIEWFGGTVSVKNVVVWNPGDDAIDTDQSWGGTLDNFIVVNPGDECFELDGPEGSMEAGHILKNGSVSAGVAEGLVDLDDNSMVEMTAIYFFGVAEGQDFDLNPAGLVASSLEATLPDGAVVTDYFTGGTDAFVTLVGEGANTVGADVSVFVTWSWAGVSGNLSGF